jgi:hypothetical protein
MITETFARKLEQIRDNTVLSRRDVARIVGASTRTVFRWATGEATPRGESRDRLLELAAVSEHASKVMRPEAVGVWLQQPNAMLNFDKPSDLIAAGEYRRVIGAIQAIGEGVFV